MLNLTEMKKELKSNKNASHVYTSFIFVDGHTSDDPDSSETFTRSDFFKKLRDWDTVMESYDYEICIVSKSAFVKLHEISFDEMTKRGMI